MEVLGQRIQQLRKQHKISQVELAEKVEISKSQMIRYETKGVQPPADVLNNFAEVFGVSIDYIINGDSQQKAKASL